MAWIESHQELRHHPKTERLIKELDVMPSFAIGCLHCLWWWALDYAPDGDLTKYSDHEIAHAAGYHEDDDNAHKFKIALINAGFLDNSDEGIFIHDWWEYSVGRLEKDEEKKEKNRERQRRFREKQKEVVERSNDVTRYEALRNERITLHNALHNNTIHNNTIQKYNTLALEDERGNEHGNDEKLNTDSKKPEKADIQAERFNEFWSLYPKKRSKKDAMKAWKQLKPTEELTATILKSLQANIDKNPDWRKNNGQFIPYPATWLRAGGWEDEICDSAFAPGNKSGEFKLDWGENEL